MKTSISLLLLTICTVPQYLVASEHCSKKKIDPSHEYSTWESLIDQSIIQACIKSTQWCKQRTLKENEKDLQTACEQLNNDIAKLKNGNHSRAKSARDAVWTIYLKKTFDITESQKDLSKNKIIQLEQQLRRKELLSLHYELHNQNNWQSHISSEIISACRRVNNNLGSLELESKDVEVHKACAQLQKDMLALTYGNKGKAADARRNIDIINSKTSSTEVPGGCSRTSAEMIDALANRSCK